MKWLKSFPDGRGGFDSMEWDMGDVGMEYVFNIFKYIFFGFFIYWFFAPLVLFLLPAENHKENRVGLIKIGIASGVILLLDYWFGGFLWLFFNLGEGEPTHLHVLHWVVALNFGVVFVLILCLWLDKELNGFYEAIDDNFFMALQFNLIFWPLSIYYILPGFMPIVIDTMSSEPIFFLREGFCEGIANYFNN